MTQYENSTILVKNHIAYYNSWLFNHVFILCWGNGIYDGVATL